MTRRKDAMAFPLFRGLILIFYFIHCILTIQVVNRCPNSENEWEARSKIFSCHKTEKYHCLRNDMDKLVELCSTVKSFLNNQGCPILSNISGVSFINTRRCKGKADLAGCPEYKSGMYYTYETFKYPSCVISKEATEGTYQSTKERTTLSKTTMDLSNLNVSVLNRIPSSPIQLDYAKMKNKPSSGIMINTLGPVAGITVSVVIALVVVAGILLFIRRKQKLNEGTAPAVHFHNGRPMMETYDDVRGIGFSPRTRVISVSTDDIARSLEEEEMSAGRSDLTIDETIEAVNDDDIFMTFDQLQSARG